MRPIGEYDLSRERELALELSDAIGAGRPLVIDLSRTTFLDSTVLGVLLDCTAALRPARPGLRDRAARGVGAHGQDGLRLLGIHRYARIFSTVDEAVAYVDEGTDESIGSAL